MTEDEKLYKLYLLNSKNEKYFLSEHQKRVSFYFGLISALIAASIAGVMKSDKWYYGFLLICGPIAIIVVSRLGKKGVNRLYQRFLESITTIKKIEHDFGLTIKRNKNPDDENAWVANECFLPCRYIKATKYNSSDEWVNNHMFFSEDKKGSTNKRERNYNGVVSLLFDITFWLALIFLPLVFIICCVKNG